MPFVVVLNFFKSVFSAIFGCHATPCVSRLRLQAFDTLRRELMASAYQFPINRSALKELKIDGKVGKFTSSVGLNSEF